MDEDNRVAGGWVVLDVGGDIVSIVFGDDMDLVLGSVVDELEVVG